jgi:hypothetical protein
VAEVSGASEALGDAALSTIFPVEQRIADVLVHDLGVAHRDEAETITALASEGQIVTLTGDDMNHCHREEATSRTVVDKSTAFAPEWENAATAATVRGSPDDQPDRVARTS